MTGHHFVQLAFGVARSIIRKHTHIQKETHQICVMFQVKSHKQMWRKIEQSQLSRFNVSTEKFQWHVQLNRNNS